MPYIFDYRGLLISFFSIAKYNAILFLIGKPLRHSL